MQLAHGCGNERRDSVAEDVDTDGQGGGGAVARAEVVQHGGNGGLEGSGTGSAGRGTGKISEESSFDLGGQRRCTTYAITLVRAIKMTMADFRKTDQFLGFSGSWTQSGIVTASGSSASTAVSFWDGISPTTILVSSRVESGGGLAASVSVDDSSIVLILSTGSRAHLDRGREYQLQLIMVATRLT